MIKAILDYLTADSELTNLIGYTPKDQRIRPYIPINRMYYPYIVFEAYPSLAGDVTTQYQVNVIILSKDVINIESVSNRLIELLHKQKQGFIEDDTTVYVSKHTGGNGINYDPDQELFEQILYFTLKAN